jgi:hypothetical protein
MTIRPAMRRFILLAASSLLAVNFLSAQATDPLRIDPPVQGEPDNLAAIKHLQGEYIVLCGGPAMRKWETLRRSYQQHDLWWANFLAGTNVRTRQLIQEGVMPSSITWLVYRPAYARRGAEEGKPLTSWVAELAAKRGVRLVWFNTQAEMIAYLNAGQDRSHNKIVSLDYFGHSNKFCFLFEYSSEVIGGSTCWLHVRDLKQISGRAFDRKAYVKSWGCHTGEAMSKAWKSAVGVPLWGALGKTDYEPTGRGQLPVLSTAAGEWSR